MTLDYKGFTEKEIQDTIDWKAQMRETDEYMWKLHAQEIIRKIVIDVMNKDALSTKGVKENE